MVYAFGELLEQLFVERRYIAGRAARDQAVIGDHLGIDPFGLGIAQVRLQRVGAGDSPPANDAGADQNPWWQMAAMALPALKTLRTGPSLCHVIRGVSGLNTPGIRTRNPTASSEMLPAPGEASNPRRGLKGPLRDLDASNSSLP